MAQPIDLPSDSSLDSGPDLVITGAALWTAPGNRAADLVGATPEASRAGLAIAVRGRRIAAVGPTDAVLGAAGPRARRLHLPGRLVVPGFQDAHVHPPFAGRYRLNLSLHDLGDVAAYRRAIADYAGRHPERPWIYGSGWAPEAFPGAAPHRDLLDDVVPDRPVFLLNASVHEAWVNTRALALAGLDAATPDPPDGRYGRAATGALTGALYEGAAYSFEARHVPAPSRDEWQAAILEAQAHLHGLGITGWQDAWVTPATLAAYAGLADDGRLTARVAAALWWQRDRGLEQIEDLLGQRAAVRHDPDRPGLLARTVKIMADGVLENGTGALLEPYCGAHAGPDSRGLTYVAPDLLAAAVTELDRLGFQVHLHTIGDRAVRSGLDAIATARAVNGPRDNRHHLAHVQLIQPADVPRFAELGAVANCQAFWAQSEPTMDELTIPVIGAERGRLQYPFADLAAAGAILAMGSDWSVTTADPLPQIEVAVTRTDPQARTNAPFLPAQRLTLGAALRAFTAGSAHVNHDDEAGVLLPGHRADLAILTEDIFASSGARAADARVEYTIAAGRVVHQPLP